MPLHFDALRESRVGRLTSLFWRKIDFRFVPRIPYIPFGSDLAVSVVFEHALKTVILGGGSGFFAEKNISAFSERLAFVAFAFGYLGDAAAGMAARRVAFRSGIAGAAICRGPKRCHKTPLCITSVRVRACLWYRLTDVDLMPGGQVLLPPFGRITFISSIEIAILAG